MNSVQVSPVQYVQDVPPKLERRALAEDPRDVELSHDGGVYTQQSRFLEDDAIAVFEGAQKRFPDNPALLNALGAALCLNNRTGEAAGYFRRALRVDPAFTPARKNLAMAEFDAGRYEEAREDLKVLSKIPAARTLANTLLGIIASDRGNDEDAIRYFEKAGEPVREQARSLLAFAGSLIRAGQATRAADLLEKMPERVNPTARDYLQSAALLQSCGRFQKALDHLSAAEQQDPTNPEMVYHRIDLLAKTGRANEALERAQRSAPSGSMLTLLASIAESAGQLAVAVDALRSAIRLEPASEDHYIDLSLLCAKYRNGPLALEIVDLGLQRIPGSYRLLIQKGIALENADKHREAQAVFSEAIALKQDHSIALAALAVSQILSGNMPEALSNLKAGVAAFPRDFYLHYLYGYALDRSRASDEDGKAAAETAAKELAVAIRLNPSFSPAYYHLGKILSSANPESAMRNLEKAIELDPGDAGAKYQLGRLYQKHGRPEEAAKLMKDVEDAKAAKLELEQKPSLILVKP